MSMPMEQVVAQLQQELQNLDLPMQCEQSTISTAQIRKDTPSHIDVKGLGRPKEFNHERGQRSAKLGVCAAADAHSTQGSHEL